ncbi:rRNA N6-adenosine-methyltransferase ZCCHC4-like [Ruditapes philippinarum]|uniref:rRNA N6-adenosine-methyltransferase ZCCHC4-like n=1 Tax=Ruditapes philippinarum TaxID=129788 RepID=UPI00295AB25A|nr:rRNA N6-adenosine-methyltransferase ZCCHC4-like [Ruditapes philippinarum]
MAVNSGNVDIVTDHGFKNIPECEHGPALLFSRFDKKCGAERHFFACSAFRDRKACPFFKWADEVKISKDNRVFQNTKTGLWPSYSHAEMRKRFCEFKELKESERHFCTNCGLMLLPGEQKSHEGQGHTVRSNISDKMLAKPTELFTPLENNKTFAQYLFSASTVDFILDTLNSLHVTHILCVGCPSLIECTDTEKMPVFWFFPYFMEQRVVTPTSGYTMLDYKVDYDNHALFKGEKGRKKGSPVRIFTNLPAKQIILPASEGYWYCEKCERYSSEENKHCKKCNTCPTKDGNTYTHCDKCNRCVKPSRVHCDTCNICDLQDHKCGQSVSKGCHICGDMGHKRRECPERQSVSENFSNKRPVKRKGQSKAPHMKKKKRK